MGESFLVGSEAVLLILVLAPAIAVVSNCFDLVFSEEVEFIFYKLIMYD